MLLPMAALAALAQNSLASCDPNCDLDIIVNDHAHGDQPAAISTGAVDWQEGTHAACAPAAV